MNRDLIRDYLLFNRNLLIGFAGSILTAAGISQVIAGFTSSLVNSIISLVSEFCIFIVLFGILFYIDNKSNFIDNHRKKRDSRKIKWVILKLVSTLSIAEIEYNIIKPAIHFWLLNLNYQPFIASTIASFIALIGYLGVANMMVYFTRLFKKS
jgi:hypothetical protein